MIGDCSTIFVASSLHNRRHQTVLPEFYMGRDLIEAPTHKTIFEAGYL
jgi:hypothetical protein